MQYEYFYGAQASSSLFTAYPKRYLQSRTSGSCPPMQGTVWDSAGSNEFVAEKSMVRCTEQGLHYLHRG